MICSPDGVAKGLALIYMHIFGWWSNVNQKISLQLANVSGHTWCLIIVSLCWILHYNFQNKMNKKKKKKAETFLQIPSCRRFSTWSKTAAMVQLLSSSPDRVGPNSSTSWCPIFKSGNLNYPLPANISQICTMQCLVPGGLFLYPDLSVPILTFLAIGAKVNFLLKFLRCSYFDIPCYAVLPWKPLPMLIPHIILTIKLNFFYAIRNVYNGMYVLWLYIAM